MEGMSVYSTTGPGDVPGRWCGVRVVGDKLR
jgi:hypothetical protein